jgi:dihydrofolate synthase/folylpolyglutamate synthase
MQTALREVKKLTGLLGRWHTINKDPLIICDTGHNEHGIKEVVKNIRSVDYRNLHMVIGMVKDKDIRKVLFLLPQEATYYFCAPKIERAKSSAELMEDAKDFGLMGTAFDSVLEALESAKMNADKGDFIFVGGSTFVVAEII